MATTKFSNKAPCSVDGCDAASKARGYCNAHYAKWKKYGDPAGGVTYERYTPEAVCSVVGRGNVPMARGWCDRHYQAWRKHGDPTASHERRPNGAGTVRHDGYKSIWRGDVRRGEHVWVAEKALGHPLPRGAVVHHVDEDPSNNTPTNLVICPGTAYHTLIHKRMRAMKASGHPDWLRCNGCARYDSPENMKAVVNRRGYTIYFHNGGCQKEQA